MPAYVPSSAAAGCKWISGYPENQEKGLKYINGLMLLNEPETGLPIAVMDAGWITAVRTGAATGLSARYLARKDSRSVGLIACGVQGCVNLEALVSELPLLQKVTCFDPVDGVVQRFEEQMGPLLEERYGRTLVFEYASEIRGAVSDQDCVVSSGPWAPGVLDAEKPIKSGWLEQGAFVSAVDMDAAFQGGALAEAATLVTDDRGQWEYFVGKGVFADYQAPSYELAELCAAGQPVRKTDAEICAAVCMGIAAEDVTTAKLVFDAAVRLEIGTVLPM